MSPIEATVLGIMAIFLTVMGIVGKMTGNKVTTEDCEKLRKHCGEIHAASLLLSVQKAEYLQKAIDGLQNSNDIQYGMLRAIVIHMSGLSDSERERILNINRKD